MKHAKGFTLIKLLIVVAIIGVLAAVGIPMYNGYITSAKIDETKENNAYASPECPPNDRLGPCYGTHRWLDDDWQDPAYALIYEGWWKNGKKHGHGTLTWLARSYKYIGEFRHDAANGVGVAISGSEGENYIGDFRNDLYDGQGTSFYENGDWYIGQWKEGRKHGEGALTSSNGDKYVGTWKEGLKHGSGTQKLEQGQKINLVIGKWRSGRPWDAIAYRYTGEDALIYEDFTARPGDWCLRKPKDSSCLATLAETGSWCNRHPKSWVCQN